MNVKTNPNVIPLCDILLVLLIIFMVITPMAQVGIDIKLPERRSKDITCGVPNLVVTIEGENMFRINRESFTKLEDLERRLAEIYINREDKVVFVQAVDPRLKYKHLVKTVDSIRHAGLTNICVIPSPKENRRFAPVPVIQRNSKVKNKLKGNQI